MPPAPPRTVRRIHGRPASPSVDSTGNLSCGPQPGYTLLEVVTVLALLGAVLLPASSAVRGVVDRLAVEGAREELVGLISRARMEGLLRGGARVAVSEEPAVAVLWVADAGASPSPGPGERVAARVDLAGGYGVALEIAGRARRANVPFGALGLGTMASRTVELSRGASRAGLVISTYGRVRRR